MLKYTYLKNQTMKNRYRILFVEDNQDDVELISYELTKNKIDFERTVVESEIDYRNSLESFDPDIIISDYFLPQFDGRKALQIKNELNPYLPFILVTGSINEDVAVEIMKSGADDYVIKQRLTRIGPAVKEALKKKTIQKERDEMEKRLKENLALMNAFLNSNRDILFVKDSDFRYILVNSAAIEFFGKPEEEILFKTDYELIDKAGAEACHLSDIEVIKKKSIVVTEEIVKDRIFETTKFPVFFSEKTMGIGAIIKDITEKKEAEKKLQEKIKELEKFTNVAVGRELKMIALKKEVNELLLRLGEKEKYVIVE